MANDRRPVPTIWSLGPGTVLLIALGLVIVWLAQRRAAPASGTRVDEQRRTVHLGPDKTAPVTHTLVVKDTQQIPVCLVWDVEPTKAWFTLPVAQAVIGRLPCTTVRLTDLPPGWQGHGLPVVFLYFVLEESRSDPMNDKAYVDAIRALRERVNVRDSIMVTTEKVVQQEHLSSVLPDVLRELKSSRLSGTHIDSDSYRPLGLRFLWHPTKGVGVEPFGFNQGNLDVLIEVLRGSYVPTKIWTWQYQWGP